MHKGEYPATQFLDPAGDYTGLATELRLWQVPLQIFAISACKSEVCYSHIHTHGIRCLLHGLGVIRATGQSLQLAWKRQEYARSPAYRDL